MGLTYTEIEQDKNRRIWVFFAVVLLFYFLVAVILGNAAKVFLITQNESMIKGPLFLTAKELIYVVLFAFLAAFLHVWYSLHNALTFVQKNLKTQKIELSNASHSRFNNIVDEANVATGSKYKITPVIVPTEAMNAFAMSDRNKNAIVGVTEGLLSKLNRPQLEAVVAHEVGHVVSGDSFQTTVGCALFGIYAALLIGIRKAFSGRFSGSFGRNRNVRIEGRGGGGIILFIIFIYLILSLLQFFYNLIRMFVSRDREFRADAIAVKLTRDPISLAEALFSISRGWRGLGYIDKSLEALFIINPVKNNFDEKEGFWANMFSTHPPIEKRIAILAEMAHVDVNNIEENILKKGG